MIHMTQKLKTVIYLKLDEYVVQLLFHIWTCLEAGRGNSERSCICGGSGSQIMAGTTSNWRRSFLGLRSSYIY